MQRSQVTVSKSHQLKVISQWGPDFKVQADITINKFDSIHRRNIFHITRIQNHEEGDRIPSVWLNQDNELEICHSIIGNEFYCENVKVQLNKKYTLAIQQYQGTLYIKLDNIMIRTVPNVNPKVYTDVALFTSDPWSLAFSKDYGLVENLQVLADFDNSGKNT